MKPSLRLVIGLMISLSDHGRARCAQTQMPAADAVPTLQQRRVSPELTIDFVDLVQRIKSACVVEPMRLVRCSSPLRIEGLTDTTVNGKGVRVVFTDPTPGNGGIVFDHARDVTIKSIEISWQDGAARDPVKNDTPRIQSLGYVIPCRDQHPGGQLSMDLKLEGTLPLGAISVWDDHLGWPWYPTAPDRFETYFPQGASGTFSAGKSNCLPELEGWAGQRVLVRHFIYANHAFFCSACNNVVIDHVSVTSAPGMAFVFGLGGSHISLINSYVGPRCAPKCTLAEPSVTADAAHFADLEGDILLERNDFGWQGDDAVNVTGLLAPARLDTDGLSSFVVEQQFLQRLAPLAIGTRILVFDRALNELGTSTVTALDLAAGRIEVSSAPTQAAELIIAREDGIPRNVIIRNNRFHDNRARGILMGGSRALIQGNTIERVTMEAILLSADTGPWYEGPGAKHVRIERNSISSVNRFPAMPDFPSAISLGVSVNKEVAPSLASPIQDVVIKSNSFVDVMENAEHPVSIGKGASEVSVQLQK